MRTITITVTITGQSSHVPESAMDEHLQEVGRDIQAYAEDQACSEIYRRIHVDYESSEDAGLEISTLMSEQ